MGKRPVSRERLIVAASCAIVWGTVAGVALSAAFGALVALAMFGGLVLVTEEGHGG